MKIIYDDQIFLEQRWGGISNLFLNYIKQINNLKKHHLKLPFLFSLNKELKKKIFFKKNKYLYFFVKILNLISININLIFFDYDILHLTYFRKNLIFNKKKKLVLSIPDMIPETNKKFFKNYKLVHPFKRDLAKRSDLIITISETTKKKILKEYKINKNKITVIYPSIKKQNKIKKKKFIIPRNYLLFVGTRTAYKNFNIVINFFKEFSKKYDDYKIICTGQSFTYEENLIINNLKLENKIKSYNNINNELKNYLYQNAKLLIFPSLDEGFGIPIIEAFSNNCPIVLSDTEIFREVAGKYGNYFKKNSSKDLYNKVIKVIKNYNKAKKLYKSKNFNIFFNRYSDQISKNKLELAYSKLMYNS